MLIVLWKVSKSDFQLKESFHSRIFDMRLSGLLRKPELYFRILSVPSWAY